MTKSKTNKTEDLEQQLGELTLDFAADAGGFRELSQACRGGKAIGTPNGPGEVGDETIASDQYD